MTKNMIILLKKAVEKKIIRPIDFYFSQFITKKNNLIMLVAACLSYELSKGCIFLHIEYFEKNNFFSSVNIKFIKPFLNILGNKINWSEKLLRHPSISDGSLITPIIFKKKNISLQNVES